MLLEVYAGGVMVMHESVLLEVPPVRERECESLVPLMSDSVCMCVMPPWKNIQGPPTPDPGA